MKRLRTILIAAALAAAARPALAQQPAAPDGAAIWRDNCKPCHGAAGVPVAAIKSAYPRIPTFDSTFVARRSDDSLMAVLRLGAGRGRARGTQMRSFASRLNAAEMHAVIGYLRTLANRRHSAHQQ